MPELAEIETPKTAGFVDRGSNYAKRQQRMEDEEKEIAELEAQQRGETKEEVTEEKEADTEVKEETLSAEEKSFKKRYGDLRRHMGEKEKEWKERLEALENRLENTSVTPPKSDEDIAEWSKKYPDVAGIVEAVAAKKAQEMFSKAEKRLQQIDEVQDKARRMELEAEIREQHSDFDELKASDKFHNWAEEQPKWVQDALYENADDPASVVRVIDLYKVDHKITKEDKKANKKAAASVVTKRSKTSVDADDAESYVKESDVAKMSAKEFEKNQDKINEALRSNKFIYDISGTAR
jgi:hypothetical protein|tara:strand:- start:66 stop:947 length:882 start_codon:yes stop_codon:yes gene_type:complete